MPVKGDSTHLSGWSSQQIPVEKVKEIHSQWLVSSAQGKRRIAGTDIRYRERSCRRNEFVIYMRGGISFIYFGPSFKARRDPFWI